MDALMRPGRDDPGGEVSAGPRPEGGWRVRTLLHVGPAPTDTGQAAGAHKT